jgi:hypothetical protein
MGISPIGLVKTEQEIAAEMQAQQQQQMQAEVLGSAVSDPQKLAQAAQTVQQMNTPEAMNG